MNSFVFDPPRQASVAVADTSVRFPVRRIYCVGRNYAAHAREMGRDPDREPPFFFQKPSDAVIDSGTALPYPPETGDLQFEIELVLGIGQGAFNVSAERALDLVFGYAVGIDLTRRDLQLQARDAGRPWSWGKGFDQSAPCAPLQPVAKVGHPSAGRIWLKTDGEERQNADIAELIWGVPEIISIISRSMVLHPGDLIFTGTPAGVGAVRPGQLMQGGVEGVGEIEIRILDRA
jgi:fumarylpyruvate hydrolase